MFKLNVSKDFFAVLCSFDSRKVTVCATVLSNDLCFLSCKTDVFSIFAELELLYSLISAFSHFISIFYLKKM